MHMCKYKEVGIQKIMKKTWKKFEEVIRAQRLF
jgi:hypothetical protein